MNKEQGSISIRDKFIYSLLISAGIIATLYFGVIVVLEHI